VRIEIESAMRLGKRVIPVLVNKAEMPRATELPEPLQPLARRNAVRLTQERFKADVQGLITALEGALHEAEAARQAASTAAAEAMQRWEEEEKARAEEAARAEKERMRLEAIAGLSPEQIAKAEELANWDFIKASASAQDFRDHLARFPRGVTERFARTRLEDLVWAALGDAPDLDQRGGFLAEFPQGAHAVAAAGRQAKLEQERAAARQASERQRRETEAWAAANEAGDAAALEAFLKEWPQGRHAKAARARIRELTGTRRRLLQGIGTVGLAAIGGGVAIGLRPGFPLWRFLHDRSVLTFTGHSGSISRVVFSPTDGRTALSGSSDKTLKLWDVARGTELRTFKGHSGEILSVAFSPDGRTALSGGGPLTTGRSGCGTWRRARNSAPSRRIDVGSYRWRSHPMAAPLCPAIVTFCRPREPRPLSCGT
jgi:WD domain, G-beta repeat